MSDNIERAMDLLTDEFEVFVLFARLGDRDPPRADGKRVFAIAGKNVNDEKLRETVRK